MRKTISMLMIFVFGASLWADQNVQKAKSENQRPKIFSEKISTDTRTESYTLIWKIHMVMDGAVQVLIYPLMVLLLLQDLTVTTSDNGGYEE